MPECALKMLGCLALYVTWVPLKGAASNAYKLITLNSAVFIF